LEKPLTISPIFSVPPIIGDLIWPALVLEKRILSVAPITAGLIVEWVALWLGGFGLSWKRAVVVDLVMNGISTLAGIVVIPVLGLAWEVLPGMVLYKVFNIGTFNSGTWLATFAMAVLATTAIEAAVVKWGFKIGLGSRGFWIICAANVASVAIAFWSLRRHPPLPRF
jgi:hypothetical protein